MSSPDTYGWGPRCVETHLVTIRVGRDKVKIRCHRDAAPNLKAFLDRYDREVERIGGGTQVDDAAYNCRKKKGKATGWSKHSWGIAGDINWRAHPQHRRGTFTRAQLAALRRLLKDFPEFEWGGDWSDDYVDEMHFEVIKTPEQCRALQAKRNAAAASKKAGPAKGPAKPAPHAAGHPFPLPKDHWYGQESRDARNHSGLSPHDADDIKLIRNRLKHPGSGRYDQVLADAVAAWTRDHMAKATSIVDAAVWRALGL